MSSDELGQTFATPSEADSRQRMQFARQCFHSIESFIDARLDRPTGHPRIAATVRDAESALEEYFEQAPSLPTLVRADGLYDFETEQQLWESSTAAEVARFLRDRGVGFLGVRPGFATDELHRLLDLLARCADRQLPFDPVSDLTFDRVRVEWLDRSSAELSGVGADLPSDSTSVTRATHRLFEREFAARFDAANGGGPSLLDFLDDRADSSESDGSSRPSIQVRRARTFRSVLEDQLDDETRDRIAENAAAAIIGLLDDGRLDTAGRCVSTLRDTDTDFVGRLRTRIESELDDHRRRRLAEMLVLDEADTRKPLLEFAHDLGSTELTHLVAATLKWDVPDSVARDVLRFLERRSEQEFRQLVEIVDMLTSERAGHVIEAAASGLPQTRPFLRDVLDLEIAPRLRAKALAALRGTWEDRDRMLDVVAPLVGTPNATLRGRAIETIAEVAPEAIQEILDPYVTESLARRDRSDLENIVRAYAEYGGSEALHKLEDLIRVKRFAGEQRRELAVQLVETLSDLEADELRTMFGRIADDWLVASPVREACKSARNQMTS